MNRNGIQNEYPFLESKQFYKENFGKSCKNSHKNFCSIFFKNCSSKQLLTKFQENQSNLVKFRDLINSSIDNNKIGNKIEKFESRILNTFELSNNLIQLASLCEIQANIGEIFLGLDEFEMDLQKDFPENKIIQMMSTWKSKLSQFNGEQKISQRMATDLEFDIIQWLKEIESITQSNTKIFQETFTEYSKLEIIQKGIDTLYKNINDIESQYSIKILRYLIIIQKKSGLTIYPEKFDPEIEIDPFLIGGFLSAISNFGTELLKKETVMKTLSYEDFEIKIEDGNQIMVALLLQGKSTKYISNGLSEFVKEFEKIYESELINWAGNLEPFMQAFKILQKIFPGIKIYSHSTKELKTPLILTPTREKF